MPTKKTPAAERALKHCLTYAEELHKLRQAIERLPKCPDTSAAALRVKQAAKDLSEAADRLDAFLSDGGGVS
jgi:hypothetical protein